MFDARARNGETIPAWPEGKCPESPPIAETSADVLVVGAGISGLSVAYHLLDAGKSVIVVDRGLVGRGETGRSSAHLSNALDDRYTFLEQAHGHEGARLAAESHRAGIESIARIAETEGIACGFERVDGFLYADDEKGVAALERELAAAQRAGLDVELIARAPASFASLAALRFTNQAQFDPRAYLLGLADAVQRRGAHLYTSRTISGFEEADGIEAQLTSGEKLRARALVMATNTPIHDGISLHPKQAAYRSYVIAIRAKPDDLARGLFWDLEDPYHYLRWLGDDVILVGGEDHRVGHAAQPAECFDRLERWARERLPSAGAVQFRWSGQVQEPVDGLAFIGKSTGTSAQSYVVTGDSGNGLTHGALAGMLITDLIVGRENPWAKLYDPHRTSVHDVSGLLSYARENATAALSYTDWMVPAAAKDVALAPGEGCVVQDGLGKLAVSMAEDGTRHVCSAVCPHLYAVVRWNSLEKTWDCPAHGSRFAPDGTPLCGPAATGLEQVQETTDMASTKKSSGSAKTSSAKKSAKAARKRPSKRTVAKAPAKKRAPVKKTPAKRAEKKAPTKTSAAKKAPARSTKTSARKRAYGSAASKKVARALHEEKKGTLRSGRSSTKVKSRKQAIAIGLSEARKSGAKVPPKKA